MPSSAWRATGRPSSIYPMPIAGATAPMTVAGTVVMNVAEFLGIATIIELAAPGRAADHGRRREPRST